MLLVPSVDKGLGATPIMIELTRLNGHPLVINSDLIKHAEAIPDTTLTLVTGEKLVVLETCADVVGRVLRYRGQVLAEAWPFADTALSAQNATRIAQAAVNQSNI